MKVNAKGYISEFPTGFVKGYPSFVNFLISRSMYKTPEQRQRELLTMTGEFSASMEIAFERSLKRLKDNKICFVVK